MLQEHRASTASALKDKILTAAAEFSSGHWHDDATLLVLAVFE
jgi:serine phosphatase RsbU (regulator of sigma subunit)